MSIFDTKSAGDNGACKFTDLVAVSTAITAIGLQANGQSGGSLVPHSQAASVLSMESFAGPQADNFATRLGELGNSLQSVVENFLGTPVEGDPTYLGLRRASLESAKIGAVLAAAPAAAYSNYHFDTATVHNGVEIVRVGAKNGDYYTRRPQLDLQSFDNTQTRQMTEWTTTYSLGAVRQNAFAQAFWTPIAVNPDEPGLLATVRARYIMDDLKRNIKGAPSDYNRRPLIHALVDDSILRDDQTDIIPVYRAAGADQNTEYFVDAALVPPTVRKWDGIDVPTSFLKFGAEFGLIELSSIDALVANGVMTQSDQLDTAIQVLSVVAKVGDDILEFNVEHFTGANFTYAVQGQAREMNTTLNVEGLLVNENTKRRDGSALTTLKPIVDGTYQVRVGFRSMGQFNLDSSKGHMDVGKGGLRVQQITVPTAPKEKLSLTAGDGKVIADLLAGAELLGYKLAARRINTNKRNRGQMIDTMEWRKYYAIPLRAPVTAIRPISATDQQDAELVQSLLETTYVRASNDAVIALFRVFGALKSVCATGTPVDINPEFMGMASRLVFPFAEEYELDALQIVDSLTSTSRTVDIQAALVNTIRDKAFQVAVRTNYFVALSSHYGGQNVMPTLLMGADQRTAGYLNIPGETRLMGPTMSHLVVASPNERMRDTIFVTFADYTEGSQGRYNPMQFGHFVIKPEVVSNAQISRGNETLREMTVMPSYMHIPNLPILIKFTVKNLDKVIAKNPIMVKVA